MSRYRLHAQHHVGEVRLAGISRVGAILVSDGPVREGAFQPGSGSARGGIVGSCGPLDEPNDRLGARLERNGSIVRPAEDPGRVALEMGQADVQEHLVTVLRAHHAGSTQVAGEARDLELDKGEVGDVERAVHPGPRGNAALGCRRWRSYV